MAVGIDFLLTHTVTVEPYLGSAGTGPTYGPAASIRCFVDDQRRKVNNTLGETVISEAMVICPLDTTAPPKSRVTVNGRTAYVITAKRRDGGGLPTPDHLELMLT